MELAVNYPRQPLVFFPKALAKKRINIGFLGGSITEARVPHNWPETLVAKIAQGHPGMSIQVENAALGATGSDFGLMRVDHDIIVKKPDLVFLEYAVNDWWTPSHDRIAAIEGLIRKLIQAGILDIILVYTFSREMIPFLQKNELPPSVADFEKLANHYGINAVFVGYGAYQQYLQGMFKFEAWLPDGLHPLEFGSHIYGELVFDFLSQLLSNPLAPRKMPTNAFLDTHWEKMEIIPLAAIQYTFPFVLKRHANQVFSPYVLSTKTEGAMLSFSFRGTGLMMTFDFGKHSGEVRYQIDAGPWQTTSRDRPSWVGSSGWLRTYKMVEQLPNREHTITLITQTAKDDANWLAHCDIVTIAVIP